ncbi:putative transporter [Wickerhamomyces ciferrii]|uniref:Transporter n=1 Tax=Wickerhamomyces ciferrii (strain ATCC 14091 / BCRC 22168 / CBS 111 / JCM 3599 / NBRC 0793 / NRRL Y-1031 F-60-10) TaxID=1206466 RepID=K0KFF5_WICCF|nr:putative transporter [Wickerhamomyces ciferrii]CCH41671.1 putative transporter [Wickerhamomyces ciferrii]
MATSISEKKSHEVEEINIDHLEPVPGSVEQFDGNFNPQLEKKMLRKMDLVILPIIGWVYLIAYLDRSNIGNAASAGLIDDLGLSSTQYSAAISLFYVTYILVEVPCSIVFKKVKPAIMLATLTLSWSLVGIFSGFVKSFGGLVVIRLLLGLIEGGLFPALTLYLASVYQRGELAYRVSYLFTAAALAGAIGGLLAYGLLKMDGLHGLKGWQWLFIIEGCISVTGAILVLSALPNDMTKAWFLNEEEQAYYLKRKQMQEMSFIKDQAPPKEDSKDIKAAFKDPKVYLSSISQFCAEIVFFGFSTFLPQIVKAMGYSILKTQLLTIPIYVVGSISFIIIASASDYFKKRLPFLLCAACFPIIGYIILLASSGNAAKMGGVFILTVGAFAGPGLNLSWLNNNTAGDLKRATSVGIQLSIGNISGVVIGQIYRSNDSPKYTLGHGFSLGCIIVAVFFYCAQGFYLRRENNKKQARLLKGDVRPDARGDESDDFIFYL